MDTRWPYVTVVVPAYNVEKTIENCIRSLLEQNYPASKVEILVVDNRSTDQTKKKMQSFGALITLIEEKKPGASCARNAGIKHATHDVIAFIDADCTADPWWLHHIVQPLTRQGVALVAGSIMPSNPGHPIQKFGAAIHNSANALAGFDVSYAAGANIATSKSLAQEIMFNEDMPKGQDVDFCWNIIKKGHLLYHRHVPDAVVYHRHEETLKGLFWEGYDHGIGHIQTTKIHENYLAAFNYRRNRMHSFKRAMHHIRIWIRGNRSIEVKCIVAFESGKSLGRFIGSLRYRYLDL